MSLFGSVRGEALAVSLGELYSCVRTPVREDVQKDAWHRGSAEMFLDSCDCWMEHGHLPIVWSPEDVAGVCLDEQNLGCWISFLVSSQVLRDVSYLSERPCTEDDEAGFSGSRSAGYLWLVEICDAVELLEAL